MISRARAVAFVALALASQAARSEEEEKPKLAFTFGKFWITSILGPGYTPELGFLIAGGTLVSYKFDDSAQLSSLIKQGADADVFASVDHAQMNALRDANLLDGYQPSAVIGRASEACGLERESLSRIRSATPGSRLPSASSARAHHARRWA